MTKKSDEFFGGEKRFEEQQFNDTQKKLWCEKNKVKLLVINKTPHRSFCKEDRVLIKEAINNLIDKKS